MSIKLGFVRDDRAFPSLVLLSKKPAATLVPVDDWKVHSAAERKPRWTERRLSGTDTSTVVQSSLASASAFRTLALAPALALALAFATLRSSCRTRRGIVSASFCSVQGIACPVYARSSGQQQQSFGASVHRNEPRNWQESSRIRRKRN